MANPQTEDGFTRIANELLEALVRFRVPGEARQVFDAILRRTYGFGKKFDRIALSQLSADTGLRRQNIVRARRKLKEMRLIILSENGEGTTYMINKDFDEWKPLSNVPNVIRVDKKALSVRRHTKETNTKEKDIVANSDHGKIVTHFCDGYLKRFRVPYRFAKAKDGKLVKEMLSAFGHDLLCAVIDAFFDAEDEWLASHGGFTIGTLSLRANSIAQEIGSSRPSMQHPAGAACGAPVTSFDASMDVSPTLSQIDDLKQKGDW